LVLVGGANGVVDIYSIPENKVQQSLKADGGAITGARWIGDRAAVSTSKGKVVIFSPLTDGDAGSFQVHNGSAKGIAVHASGEILASIGEDGSYVLYDLQTMEVLSQVMTATSKYCNSERCEVLTDFWQA
jgi:pre-mRNA-processing factor 19